ncbi:MAG: S16 family serine protease [Desulfatibacillaceae bacterium]
MAWRKKPDNAQEPEPEEQDDLEYLENAVKEAQFPPDVREVADKELARLSRTHPSVAEYSIGVNYLEFLCSLPWNQRTEAALDLARAEAVLDESHFGLEGVKDRILEYLAVQTLHASRSLRVLVVDDERITRENVRHVLEKEGFDTTAAADGLEALSLLDREDFDLVITDMKMGPVDGAAVLDRAKLKNPSTEVVVITGYATVDSAVSAMRRGAYHYLCKPFKLEEIRDVVRQIRERKSRSATGRGPILCFTGPPGTGKTSLARMVARALGREFVRLSLAGLKDESELRGHRRTYAGAMPGRLIQEIRRLGVRNPVFLLDEMDKAIGSLRGDPTAALLEVLDPEQNRTYMDYYLEVPFDLSEVFFIATTNVTDSLPPALLDRMEVMHLSGYTEAEKVTIAKEFIIPRQVRECGLGGDTLEFTDDAVRKVIEEHTREAGLRGLEREVARLCRKYAREVVANGTTPTGGVITEDEVQRLLGPRRFYREVAAAHDREGVATSVFLTENGGEIVFVEATIMRGRSEFILTGSLGSVMQESARAALSYLRANAGSFGLDEDFFAEQDIHVHVPAGAVSKDGPSAGLPLAMALLSLLTRRPARRDVACTGEFTLSGRLLPVAGIREKVLAAKRAGVRGFVMPEKNRVDFENLPEDAWQGMNIVFASSLEDAAEAGLLPRN